jgi:hypothetical protein
MSAKRMTRHLRIAVHGRATPRIVREATATAMPPEVQRSLLASLRGQCGAGPPKKDRRCRQSSACAGMTFEQKLKKQAWIGRDFVVRDPDGNAICFVQRNA